MTEEPEEYCISEAKVKTSEQIVLQTPVVVIAYNRPDLLRSVLESLKESSIDHLLFVLDGPKETEDDRSKCARVRGLIGEIDWVRRIDICDSEVNMGLRERVVTGLDWVFSIVSEAIIIEDDCIPAASFLVFASYCLKRYRNESRIWTICGQNLQQRKKASTESYYLSSYAHCWGWATWRDRWIRHTFERDNWCKELIGSKGWRHRFKRDERLFWKDVLSGVEMGRIRSWAYQWQACIWINNGYTITPSVNLVSNIGFSEEGTNTISQSSRLANMKVGILNEIIEPRELVVCERADRNVFEWVYLGGTNPRVWVIKRRIKRLVKYIIRAFGYKGFRRRKK